MNTEQQETKQYLWVVQSPINTDVGLRDDKRGIHAIDDHPEDTGRKLSYPFVPEVIKQPRFIYTDNTKENRVRYIDYVFIPEYKSIHNLVVVVDTNSEPHEIVTWILKRDTRQEKILEGGIIYDSRSITEQSSQIRRET